jgi:protein TonB
MQHQGSARSMTLLCAHRFPFLALWMALGMLGACSSVSQKASGPPPAAQLPAPLPPLAPATPMDEPPAVALASPVRLSKAATPRDYRRDAASHIYAHNSSRIYSGKLPPLLYAVGVLDVDIDPRGHVTDIRWVRAPRHAPEVMADIERSVRAAAPYPAPVRLGSVTYTETWLWHKSGRFQLDTLTEGQM